MDLGLGVVDLLRSEFWGLFESLEAIGALDLGFGAWISYIKPRTLAIGVEARTIYLISIECKISLFDSVIQVMDVC